MSGVAWGQQLPKVWGSSEKQDRRVRVTVPLLHSSWMKFNIRCHCVWRQHILTLHCWHTWMISHEFENLENCNNFLLVSVWCRVNVVESETLSSSQWMKLVGWELSWLSCECFHLFFMMSLRTIVTSTMFLHLTIKARHQNISQSRPETFCSEIRNTHLKILWRGKI